MSVHSSNVIYGPFLLYYYYADNAAIRLLDSERRLKTKTGAYASLAIYSYISESGNSKCCNK